ncbi:hypothetical protein LCGC14_2224860, partial [marine sediment metagenome]
ALFLAALGLGVLGRRFWCRCICPSGAIFSVANFLRLTSRQVTSECIECGRCTSACTFDAIDSDFTTHGPDCTFCQTCGAACPTRAIRFAGRWDRTDLKGPEPPDHARTGLSRRGFIAGGLAGAGVALGVDRVLAAASPGGAPTIRPPGSLAEEQFGQLCVRCGECINACPTGVLTPKGFFGSGGSGGLWTPRVDADFSGCDPKCNICGQVCPTGAIRALALEAKNKVRMGLAVVNEKTCLPWLGTKECELCVLTCTDMGFNAIEYRLMHVELDEMEMPIEYTGMLAPFVLEDKCVGCGNCQARCRAINVDEEHFLTESAIIIEAGPGKEDRPNRA